MHIIGSKTSTSKEFLNTVSPKFALIGVGKNNKFGHPNDEIISRLNKKCVNIFRTDENGEINIIVDRRGKMNIFDSLKHMKP